MMKEVNDIKAEYKKTYKQMGWLMSYNLILVVTSLIDISCASFISDDAVISLTIACSIYHLMFSAYRIFCRAFRVIASKYYGAKDEESETSALTMTTMLSCTVSVVVAIMMIIFGKNIIGLFNMTVEQSNDAYAYLMTRLPGYCLYSFTNPIKRAMEAKGKNAIVTRVELINLLNIPFSLLFMQFWGLVGIGCATSLVVVFDLLLVLCLFKPKYGKWNGRILAEVTKTGLSYLPECTLVPIISTITTNLCLIYLSVSAMVISQIVHEFYDNNIVDIMYMCTQTAETNIGREYGANNKEGIRKEFKIFKHCYVCMLLWHIPITGVIGYIYFEFFTGIEDIGLALLLLMFYIVALVPYYIGIAASRILYVYNIIKPVMIARVVGLVILEIPIQYIAFILGADIFCIPISYLLADLPWCVTNTVLLKKLKLNTVEM